MADNTKNQDNKDADQSGRPVQLDPGQQGGKSGQQQGGKGGQQDKAGQQQQGGQHDNHQDKQGAQQGQNR